MGLSGILTTFEYSDGAEIEAMMMMMMVLMVMIMVSEYGDVE